MILEQDFQNALMVALSRTGLVRVWRQPAGKILTKNNTAVQAAPVGAADITGVVIGSGRMLQIECKGAATSTTNEQKIWADNVTKWGAVYLCCRIREGELLIPAVDRCVQDVLTAIGAGG